MTLTAGPWRYEKLPTKYPDLFTFNVLADQGWQEPDGTYRTCSVVFGIDSEANARLIAAAPELLAALKDLIGDIRNDENGLCTHCGRDNAGHEDEPCHEDCPGEIARAAIAKAESSYG